MRLIIFPDYASKYDLSRTLTRGETSNGVTKYGYSYEELCLVGSGTVRSLRSNEMQPTICDSCTYLYNSLGDFSLFVAKQVCTDQQLGLEYRKVSKGNNVLLPVIGIFSAVLCFAFVAICYYVIMERRTRSTNS